MVLAPALLFLTGGSVLFASCDSPGGSETSDLFAAFTAGHCVSLPVDSPDLIAHSTHLRNGKHPQRPDPLPFRFMCRSAEVERPITPVRSVDTSNELAVCWQFACRAAAQPRAPSFVS